MSHQTSNSHSSSRDREVDSMKEECQITSEIIKGGRCCCNCAYHIEDFEHCTTNPTLREEKHGCICSIHKGWICMAPEFERGAFSGWPEHGMCEMHEFKVKE